MDQGFGSGNIGAWFEGMFKLGTVFLKFELLVSFWYLSKLTLNSISMVIPDCKPNIALISLSVA